MANADSNGAYVPRAFTNYLASIGAVSLANPTICTCCGEGAKCHHVDAETLCESCLRSRHGFDEGTAYVIDQLRSLLDDLT